MDLAEQLGNPAELDAWLRKVWRIVPDPWGAEFIRSPYYQLRLADEHGGIFQGDCDDAATLAACLLYSISWPCRLIALRRLDEPEFFHVFVRAPMLEYAPAGETSFQVDIDPIVPAAELPIQGEFEKMEVWL